MGIRQTFRAVEDGAFGPAFGVDAMDHRPIVPRANILPDEDGSEPDDSQTITGILRGSDLDALLNGVTGSGFLYGDWAEELPGSGMGRDLAPFTDIQDATDKGADTALVLPGLSDEALLTKDADIAQVLPGVIADEFLLSKDADLPLVLPGELGDVPGLLDQNLDLDVVGFPTHMLTLHPDGGFEDGSDDIGRLHDHDGWLF